uniref:Uncharacterized protein n=1 Tax=Anopheles dirus TaxID=7168 RepID=A0A182NXS9_9DIPT
MSGWKIPAPVPAPAPAAAAAPAPAPPCALNDRLSRRPPSPSSSESENSLSGTIRLSLSCCGNRSSLSTFSSSSDSSLIASSGIGCTCTPGACGSMRRFSNSRFLIFSRYSFVFWFDMLLGLMCSLKSGPKYSKLKQPSRSPVSESAPHCSTTADGWNVSITFEMIGTKIESYDSSSMPSRSGMFTAYPPPQLMQISDACLLSFTAAATEPPADS